MPSVTQQNILTVSPKLIRRYYEAIVLEAALTEACPDKIQRQANVRKSGTADKAEDDFQKYLNAVSQISDSFPGPDTITSYAVLNGTHGTVRHCFTSNQLSEAQREETQAFITGIFRTLGDCDDSRVDSLAPDILRRCLEFCEEMISCYVRELLCALSKCEKALDEEAEIENSPLRSYLRRLHDLLDICNQSTNDRETSRSHETLVLFVYDLYGRENQEGRTATVWSELRHLLGRLRSYRRAVDKLIAARKTWKILFQGFQIEFGLPSSPRPNPMLKKSRPVAQRAEEIIGRMTSSQTEMSYYKGLAQDLQRFGLDDRIHKQVTRRKFRPIVHAEVQMLNWIEREGSTDADRFFLGYKFIGCSKPTCRLCEYHFDAHESGIRVRPGHRNLYPSCWLPETPQGEVDEKLANKIIARVREDAFRTLKEKAGEKRSHDSNTETSYPYVKNSLHESFAGLAIDSARDRNSNGSTKSVTRVHVQEFEQLSPASEAAAEDGGDYSDEYSAIAHGSEEENEEQSSRQALSDVEEDEDEDEEVGGVLVFSGRRTVQV